MSQSKCIDPYDRFRLYWAHNQGGDNHSEQQFSLGKDPATKSDEFLEKSKGGRGGVIFNPKIYVADFGNFKQGFLSMKLIQKSNFRVQDMFFNNCIDIN